MIDTVALAPAQFKVGGERDDVSVAFVHENARTGPSRECGIGNGRIELLVDRQLRRRSGLRLLGRSLGREGERGQKETAAGENWALHLAGF